MDAKKLRDLTHGKTKTFTVRINPDLLLLLDEAINGEYEARNEFIEHCILTYLEKKGKL